MQDADDKGTTVDPERLLGLRFVAAEARRAARRRTSATPGPFVTRRRGRGSETDDVRTWSHGDDIRHIDRNVTARTGEPHVRTFRDERERTTLLVADFRPAMLFGTRRAFLSVAAAEALALAGWSANADGGRVGLYAVSAGEPVFVKPAPGDRAMVAAIGGLARAHRRALSAVAAGGEATGDGGLSVPGLEAALENAARMLPPGGTLVLASGLDGADEAFDTAARRVTQRVDLDVLVLSDAFERVPPRGVYPFQAPDGRRAVGLIDGPPRTGDGRVERMRALGARALLLPAEASPETIAHQMEGLDAGRV
ncbi:DUF58 domain-containing protein [Mongoliimonas terrestris]|uniref:DUF58 domain-containing protein n=1 Tax=Mongoliimonas terrestris TaxID=1709001 RepID=UPI000949AE17|nr:DUF58 domain-containing protein [Mongoliimonas terrestris]